MNLPAPFITNMESLLGREEAHRLFASLQEPSPVSIRPNPQKHNTQPSTLNSQLPQVPWCPSARYLPERPAFTFDPLFHAGCYYVQEPSSMFLEQAVRQHITEPVLALDLCAAPGGKSTHLRSLLPEGSFLVANEVIRPRSYILAENLTKWGHPGVMVTNNDPADFPETGAAFDLILADVPCSGEGMFRKDAGAISEWSPENVDICRLRQRRIIADVWPSLNPGGILIYSTCTYNTKEDEENVDWISRELGAESLPVSIKEEWNITGDLSGGSLPVYRFLPHKVSGEGFFMAVLRKTGDETATLPSPKARKDKKPQVPSSAEAAAIRQAKSWLSSPDDYVVSLSGNKVIAAPCIYKAEQDALSRKLRVLQNGILAGELKGKDLIPAHHLGMSDGLSAGAFPRVEVSYEQAISYLRKEVLVFDQSTPRGYVLLLYKGTPLGFVKNIGSRANNLYPQEWRIRSGYLHPHNLFR